MLEWKNGDETGIWAGSVCWGGCGCGCGVGEQEEVVLGRDIHDVRVGGEQVVLVEDMIRSVSGWEYNSIDIVLLWY